MGTVLPSEASSAILYTVSALSFGLIGLLEGGGQGDLEVVIDLGMLGISKLWEALATVVCDAWEHFFVNQEM